MPAAGQGQGSLMAGGWASIADEQGRYTGAGSIEHGGDAEELAQDVFGMVTWLAAQLEDVTGVVRAEWITRAKRGSEEGLRIGGRASGLDEED